MPRREADSSLFSKRVDWDRGGVNLLSVDAVRYEDQLSRKSNRCPRFAYVEIEEGKWMLFLQIKGDVILLKFPCQTFLLLMFMFRREVVFRISVCQKIYW